MSLLSSFISSAYTESATGMGAADPNMEIRPEFDVRAPEHQHRPLGPARLVVEHHAPPLRERVLFHERLRAEEPGLLGVGDEEHDVVAQPCAVATSALAVSIALAVPAPSSLAPGPSGTES